MNLLKVLIILKLKVGIEIILKLIVEVKIIDLILWEFLVGIVEVCVVNGLLFILGKYGISISRIFYEIRFLFRLRVLVLFWIW